MPIQNLLRRALQAPHFSRTALNLAAVAAVVAAAPAWAQNTTSAVSGRVTDAQGRPVAGAVVAITHVESGQTVHAATDADGRYAARGLRVGGPYTITIGKDGRREERSNVFLALAETLGLDATLGQPVEQVTVTGQSVSQRFSRDAMGAGTALGSAQISALASINRNLQDYARTDPRLSQTDKERGEISAGGQNSRFNRITIDGVTTSDTFGLESNNLPTLKQPVSMDAIQAVQVNLSNYDVTQKGYTGANINAVTKSGTNEFKGSVYYVFRNDSLAGQRYDLAKDTYASPPKFKEDLMGFTLGGPLVQDKLFFFASYEELRSSRNAPDFGPVGDAKPNAAITPAAMEQAAAIARNTWGFDAGSFAVPANAELVVKDTLLKLDWNVNDNHRANLRYTRTEQTEPLFPNIGANVLSLSGHWYRQDKRIETLVGQWFADWSDHFSTEAKLSWRDYTSAPVNNSTLPQIGLNFTNALPTGVAASTPNNRTLFLGTERSRHNNNLATKTADAYLAGTWTLGAHELKGGVDFSRNEVFNAFLQDVYGNYSFRCVNASASYSYSFGSINCATATAAQVEQAVLENFQRGRPVVYTVQVPHSGYTVDDGAARWTLASTGVFLQDTWRLNQDFTLTAGLRLDSQSTGQKPAANTAAAAALVAGSAANPTAQASYQRQSGGFGRDNTQTLDGTELLQPRLGFNWKLPTADKRRLQLRGGVGLFEGAAPTVWLSNPYSNTGVVMKTVGCGTGAFAACNPAGGLFTTDVNNQPSNFAGSPPAANVDFIEPGLKQPSVWKANLALDAELPWHGLVLGAEWLHTKVNEGMYYRHLNLGAASRTGSDGRELFHNAVGYDPNCWTASGSYNAGATASTGASCGNSSGTRALANAAYGNVLLAARTTQGGGDALTLSLAQQPSRNFGWQLAYTRTSAKEVSPLTSSVANSNWAGRSVFNPNEEVAANANYLVRDRVSASASWSARFVGEHKTSFGLFYEGRSGKPYSWTFNNDLNGDGQAGNDLMYIPSAPGSGEVIFAGGAADEARFWDIVNRHGELSRSKGQVVGRNTGFSPWVNTFDLRISQELPGFRPKHKGVITLDILNVGNLLNRRWGRTDEVAFQSAGGLARSFVNGKGIDPASGKYVYATMATEEALQTRQAKGESQWAAQVTLRYEF